MCFTAKPSLPLSCPLWNLNWSVYFTLLGHSGEVNVAFSSENLPRPRSHHKYKHFSCGPTQHPQTAGLFQLAEAGGLLAGLRLGSQRSSCLHVARQSHNSSSCLQHSAFITQPTMAVGNCTERMRLD